MGERRVAWAELWTPAGPGGVAVIAVHGPERVALAAQVWSGARTTVLAPAAEPRVVDLCHAGEPIDRAVVVLRPDWIELHVHASPAVLERLAQVLGPLAEPTATAAERLLRTATSQEQLALALEQRGVDWRAFVAGLAALPAAERAGAVAAARERSRVAMALATPEPLVICGAQNAGKSTLLNRLLLAERALAGGLAGLTRDPVRERTCLAGYPYEVVDTAGDGALRSDLDRAALAAGHAARAGAWLLLVVDGSVGPSARDLAAAGPRTLVVRNKADLPQAEWPAGLGPWLRLSCLDPGHAPRIRDSVGRSLRELRRLPSAGPVGGPAALAAADAALLDAL